jgi:selenocysteine lyase/cysteine desulfurase
MKNMVDITLYGAPKTEDVSDYVPVLLFNKKGYDCETLADLLADKGFALRAGFHCAPNAHITLGTGEIGGVRLSLGASNTLHEIKRFLATLSEI